jgi:hypothetical protein
MTLEIGTKYYYENENQLLVLGELVEDKGMREERHVYIFNNGVLKRSEIDISDHDLQYVKPLTKDIREFDKVKICELALNRDVEVITEIENREKLIDVKNKFTKGQNIKIADDNIDAFLARARNTYKIADNKAKRLREIVKKFKNDSIEESPKAIEEANAAEKKLIEAKQKLEDAEKTVAALQKKGGKKTRRRRKKRTTQRKRKF